MVASLSPAAILESPSLFPVRFDFERRVASLVPMTRRTYRDSVFLDSRTRTVGPEVYEVRLDDLLLAAADHPAPPPRVHFIFNHSFCCSTLLARHFESRRDCFVLKEPVLLAQLAVAPNRHTAEWDEAVGLALRLLSRTFNPGELVVIKPNEWCNRIAVEMLRRWPGASATLLATPARDFLLAVLKHEDRRAWIRKRIATAVEEGQAYPELAAIAPESASLSDARAACYIWMLNRCLVRTILGDAALAPRVTALNGNHLSSAPGEGLAPILRLCGLPPNPGASAPAASYSKGVRHEYTDADRSSDLSEQAARWGGEVREATNWAEELGLQALLAY